MPMKAEVTSLCVCVCGCAESRGELGTHPIGVVCGLLLQPRRPLPRRLLRWKPCTAKCTKKVHRVVNACGSDLPPKALHASLKLKTCVWGYLLLFDVQSPVFLKTTPPAACWAASMWLTACLRSSSESRSVKQCHLSPADVRLHPFNRLSASTVLLTRGSMHRRNNHWSKNGKAWRGSVAVQPVLPSWTD